MNRLLSKNTNTIVGNDEVFLTAGDLVRGEQLDLQAVVYYLRRLMDFRNKKFSISSCTYVPSSGEVQSWQDFTDVECEERCIIVISDGLFLHYIGLFIKSDKCLMFD